ncbi:hypothetical protein DAPPUDRAFT_251725 [Daphnia pulex]|uniref:Uncharacterized protein n=1 Tax=Daphnia pulex TaxID=6669 RepID=E9H100_DAPPU|nr:hypothetical protein DAPPUDRAFT_251725 [Daphnia pulex]|eukprot:EFX74612.1 hypothetical protein DAPPUDRAFT_251725 [Daphnia pulex]
MFQNVHDELATTKNELEEKKREISDIKEKNLRLTNDDSRLRREIEDRDNLIASSRAELENLRVCLAEQQLETRELAVATRELESKSRTISELETKNLRLSENDSQLRRQMEDTNRLLLSSKAEMERLRVSFNNQTDTIEQLGDQTSSLTPRNGEEIGIKVEKPIEMPVIEQVETLQNNPESLNFQTREAIYATESLSDEMPADNQEPVEERPSNPQLGMDEKQSKSLSESLAETIDDTGNVTNDEDQQLLGETELTEIAEELIIPEKSEQVEQQPSKVMKLKKSSILGLKTSTVGFVNLDMSSLENGLNKLQLYDESNNLVGKACLELDIKIEYPLTEVIPSPEIVSKPKDTLAEVPSSNGHELEKHEIKPEPESLNENLQQTIDDTGNVTNKDTVVETKLLEIAEGTIIPEENEQVEKQPSKAQSKTTDHQFRHKPGDSQAQSQIPEKTDLFNKKDNQPRHVPKDPHALPQNPEKSDCHPGKCDCEARPRNPFKHVKIRVISGVNLPEAKDNYYVSLRARMARQDPRVHKI